MNRFPAATVALLATGCGNSLPPQPQETVVAAGYPLQRDVTDWDDYVGRFEAIQDVEVRPRVSGVVTRIGFAEGREVGRDQFLFEIDPRPYRAALARAEAEVARADAQVVNARAELDRAQELLANEWISRQLYEQRLAAARSAAAGWKPPVRRSGRVRSTSSSRRSGRRSRGGSPTNGYRSATT